MRPLLANETRDVVPVGRSSARAARVRSQRYARSSSGLFCRVDVELRDFPVVDAGVARLSGIGEHDAAVEVVEVDRKLCVE